MKEIKTKNGISAWVDDEFYEQINKYSWHIAHGPKTSYFHTNIGRDTVPLHRLILSIAYNMDMKDIGIVDHINRNGLDNQLSNLRIVSSSESCQNRGLIKNCHSSYTGVSKSNDDKKWVAYISKDHNRMSLGTFDSEDRAATTYDVAAIKLYGSHAKLNFPEKRDRYIKMVESGIDPIPEKLIPYSEYSGVTFRKDLDRWQAYISIGQQKELNLDGDHRIVVGIYSTEQEAIDAHKKALDDLVQGKEILTPYQEQCKFKYYGIQLNPSGKYQSKINYNGENHSLGTYDTQEDAAEIYDLALVKLGSDLSKLNFPNKLSEYRAKIQSGFNPISEKKKKTSKYKGVSYRSDKKKWESYIYDSTTKKNLRLGYFASEEEAYETKIKKCKELGISVQ